LALVDARLGDLDAAREEQTRTIELWERSLGSTHPFVAVGLGELADVVRRQGENAEAARLLRRALRIRERSVGPRHRDTAYTLADLAATVMGLGQRAEARRLAGRALSILQRTETEDSPALATTLELHARLQLADRQPELAIGYFERALAVRTRTLGSSHPLVADVMVGLATAQSAMGRPAEAMRSAQTAENVARDHLHLMLQHLPERESLNYAAARPRGLDLILSLVTGDVDTAASFDALLRSRALVLDEMAVRHRLGSSEPGVADLQAKLVAAQQQLANVLVRGPRDSAVERYLLLVNEARRSKEAAERALVERSAAYRAELSDTQAGHREIQHAIAADAALVSYVRFQRIEGSRRPVPSYLAFVTRHDRGPVAIPLGAADVLERRITRWRTIVNGDSTNRGRHSAAQLRDAGRALRAALWDPLAPALAGVANIFVVPDAAVNLVPLAGLPGYSGEYVVEEPYNIHYLSSERDLVRLHTPSRQTALLALGGAAFDDVVAPVLPARGPRAPVRSTDAPCEAFENLRFTPLAGTLGEVKEISRVWNEAVPGSTAASRLLLAGQADETTFKREASQYRVLHLATHGFFLNGPCVTQATRTRAVGGLVRTDDLIDQSYKRINQAERRLGLSGLALAGANRRGSAAAADDDGILTAEEVAGLDLRNVEWAVLSACNTGVGELRAGEGVLGLRRAFEVAGVHTVIMSLWPVEDDVTRQWMVALYEARLKNRQSTSAAMRDASLVVLHRRRAAGQSTSPFLWAAFVAAGAWQ
jgi:CHAT domain-containing protein